MKLIVICLSLLIVGCEGNVGLYQPTPAPAADKHGMRVTCETGTGSYPGVAEVTTREGKVGRYQINSYSTQSGVCSAVFNAATSAGLTAQTVTLNVVDIYGEKFRVEVTQASFSGQNF